MLAVLNGGNTSRLTCCRLRFSPCESWTKKKDYQYYGILARKGLLTVSKLDQISSLCGVWWHDSDLFIYAEHTHTDHFFPPYMKLPINRRHYSRQMNCLLVQITIGRAIFSTFLPSSSPLYITGWYVISLGFTTPYESSSLERISTWNQSNEDLTVTSQFSLLKRVSTTPRGALDIWFRRRVRNGFEPLWTRKKQ